MSTVPAPVHVPDSHSNHGVHVPARARTAVDHARYLINPKAAGVVPASLATRSTLRSLRYVFKVSCVGVFEPGDLLRVCCEMLGAPDA